MKKVCVCVRERECVCKEKTSLHTQFFHYIAIDRSFSSVTVKITTCKKLLQD